MRKGWFGGTKTGSVGREGSAPGLESEVGEENRQEKLAQMCLEMPVCTICLSQPRRARCSVSAKWRSRGGNSARIRWLWKEDGNVSCEHEGLFSHEYNKLPLGGGGKERSTQSGLGSETLIG